jgi:hypothetical protein
MSEPPRESQNGACPTPIGLAEARLASMSHAAG